MPLHPHHYFNLLTSTTFSRISSFTITSTPLLQSSYFYHLFTHLHLCHYIHTTTSIFLLLPPFHASPPSPLHPHHYFNLLTSTTFSHISTYAITSTPLLQSSYFYHLFTHLLLHHYIHTTTSIFLLLPPFHASPPMPLHPHHYFNLLTSTTFSHISSYTITSTPLLQSSYFYHLFTHLLLCHYIHTTTSIFLLLPPFHASPPSPLHPHHYFNLLTSTTFSRISTYAITSTPLLQSSFPDHHSLCLLPFIPSILAPCPIYLASCKQRTSIMLFLSSPQASPSFPL